MPKTVAGVGIIGFGAGMSERNFKLIVSQRPVDFCRVVTADEATVLFVAFLAMVGHVDDDGILLLENGYEIPSKRQKKAYLLEKNMHKEGILKVLEMAKADRAAGKQVLVVNMKKNKKFQKDQLIAEGYEDITDCYKDSVMDL